MSFAQQLNDIMGRLGCSGRELAQASGLSASTVARYRSGARRPDPAGAQVAALAAGLAQIAAERGAGDLDAEQIRGLLAVQVRPAAPSAIGERLDLLLEALGVSRGRFAQALNYDPSFISRICSGARRPADAEDFANRTCDFVLSACADPETAASVARLIAPSADPVGGPAALRAPDPAAVRAAVRAWLFAPADPSATAMEGFLRKVDAFDLNAFIAALDFSGAQAGLGDPRACSPGAPRTYQGVEQLCAGELDFLAMAAAVPGTAPVVLYSDMPMEDQARVPGFPQRWMAGLAMLLRSGHPIQSIHEVSRPFPEMMLGLEAWLPLYMTGLVQSLYLPGERGASFWHHLRAAEGVCLEGEGVVGCRPHVRYVLSCDPDEVAYRRQRAADLLRRARPLAETFTVGRAGAYGAFWDEEVADAVAAAQGGQQAGGPAFTCTFSAPPLYTMDEETLGRVLGAALLDQAGRDRVRAARARQLELLQRVLAAGGSVAYTVARLTPEEFAAAPARLALGDAFCDADVPYDWDSYCAHLAATERFAADHAAWGLAWDEGRGFRNIQIRLRPGCWALVSKATSPAIHFLFRHPSMVRAIERMELPVVM